MYSRSSLLPTARPSAKRSSTCWSTNVLPSKAVEWWASWYQMAVQMSSASAGEGESPEPIPQIGDGFFEALVHRLAGGASGTEFVVLHFCS